MAEPVRGRFTDGEGRRLQQIVWRGKHDPGSKTPDPAIARLVATDEDTARDVIHPFNEKGLAALDLHTCHSLGYDQLRYPAPQRRRPHPGRAHSPSGRPAPAATAST